MSLVVLAGLVLAEAHRRALSCAPICDGLWLVADHLFDLAAAAGLLLLCAGAGRSAARRYDPLLDRPWEAFLLALALGAGLVSSGLLLLGLLGGFRPPVLALAALGAALLARRGIVESARLAAAGARALARRARRLDLAVLGLVVLVLLVKAVMPPTEWDSLMYHLEIPRGYLQAGRIGVVADNCASSYALLAHMLYVPLLSLGSLAGPALVSALFGVALALAAHAVGGRLFGDAVASRALSLLWGSPTLLAVAMTPRVDATLSFYLLLVHGLVLRALLEESARPLLAPAAVLLGFAVGVKPSASVYAAALAREGARAALAFAAWSAAALLPCLLKVGLTSPFLHADGPGPRGVYVLEPWLAALCSAQGRWPSLHPYDLSWLCLRSRDVLELFRAPDRLMPVGGDRLQTLNRLCLLLPFGFLLRARRAWAWLAAPPLAYAAVIIGWVQHADMRYLAPIMAPLTLAALRVAQEILERLRPRARAPAFLIGLAFALAPTAVFARRELARNGETLRYLSGRASVRDALRADHLYAGDDEFQREFEERINRTVPPDGLLLMLFEARSFYLDVPTLQDARMTNWLILSQLESPAAALRARGVTHVLVNYGAANYFYALLPARSAPVYVRLAALKRFADAHLVPVIKAPNGSVLYRLR